MKIIHIVEAFSTGIFDFLVDLTHHLPAHRLIIIHGIRDETPTGFESYFPLQTKFIHWKHASRELSLTKDYLAFKELFTLLRAIKKIDVIHLHSSKAGFIGRIVTRLLGYNDNVIYTPHGVSFLRKDIPFIKYRLFILLEQIGALLSGRVVACSQSEADEFISVGIPAHFINNGIIDRKYQDQPLHSTITIATIGRISVQKNPFLFNEIAEYFKPFPKINFLWIGIGGFSKYLISDNIKITGWLSKNEVFNSINNCDIYLSTSLWEGLPLSVLQAMNAEKPIVLSNCTGNKDLVQGNGYLFNNKQEAIEAIELLVNNKNKRYLLGKKSKQLVIDLFSIEQMAKDYWTFYTVNNAVK